MQAAPTRPRTQLSLLADPQLLARFVARGDEDAFAVLVQRHGPMVLGLCRRVLGDKHDSEDAFQAVFVVLARKAGSIGKHGSVASWLYKVAYRIALRARSNRARLQARQVPVQPGASDGPFGDAVLRELQQVMDEELALLPEKYRAPLVLCYFQGQTNEEAAAALECPTGTVKIRLSRGREILRKRLVRRGVALSIVAGLAELLSTTAQAAVPQPLARTTCRAAVGAGEASGAVARMADTALRSMGMAKLKVAAVALITLSLMCVADCLFNRAAGAPTAAVPVKTTPSEPAPSYIPSQPLLALQDLPLPQE